LLTGNTASRARRLLIGWLALLSLLLCSSAQAQEQARVLVLGVAPAQPSAGLVESLRIQLGHLGVVEAGPMLVGPTLEQRQQEAEQLRVSRRATLAVWVEQEALASGVLEPGLVLHMVGGATPPGGRRLSVPPGPAADRALALLVREALPSATTSTSSASAGTARAPAQGEGQEPDVASVGPPWAFMVDAGATFAAGSGTADPQAGFALALGARWRVDRWLGELYLGAHFMSVLSVDGADGQLRAREFPVLGGVCLLYGSEYVAIGGMVEPGLRLVEINAQSPRGATGTSFRAVPTVLLAPELRVLTSPWVQLRAAPGVELPLLRQRFAINGTPVLDLGPARAVAQLSVVGSLP
jgi:hypothetical protein